MSRKLLNVMENSSKGTIMKGYMYEENGNIVVDYEISGNIVKSETFNGHNKMFAEDAIRNWLNSIKVLNG